MNQFTRIGTVVAGYRVESLLGRGGMSVVYLAEHVRLGRKVALKVLAPALAEDERFRERFIRESQRAAQLDHPNVIPIYDAGEVEGGEADGLLYIAMRHVEGSDLKSLIRREGPLSVGRALFILEQVASALDAAHDQDLIHRDVKPANILIAEPSDRVYLTDFGVVKSTTSRGLTRTGIFIGTADYAAPEQIEGLPPDARTDVYALGCVLYEMLVGRPPFDREAEVAVMHAHLTESPPLVTDSRPDLPRALNRVVATAMAKSKDDRFSTCPELAEAARAAILQRQPAPEESLAEPAPAMARAAVAPQAAAPVEDLAAAEPPREAPPVGAQAAAPPEEKERGRHGRRLPAHWLVTAVLVVVAAASSAAVAVVVARDGSGSSAPAARSAAPLLPLEELVPKPLYDSCTSASRQGGALERSVCVPASDSGNFAPDRWEVATFANGRALRNAYELQRRRSGVKAGSGRCDGVSWGGEAAWVHGPGKPGGRRFCFFDGNDAVIVWTHERLDQPTHRDMLAIAREGGSDHPGLFNWWRFWHHRIGRAGT